MTGIGLRIKELRQERDLTMEMLVADMNARYMFENTYPHMPSTAYLLHF